MTKPSYEELERQLAELKRGLRNNNTDFELAFLDHYLDHFKTLTSRAETAETSLARVRGLLQRAYLFIWSDELRKEIAGAVEVGNDEGNK